MRIPDVSLDGLSARGGVDKNQIMDLGVAGAGAAIGFLVSTAALNSQMVAGPAGEPEKGYGPYSKGALQAAIGLGIVWAASKWGGSSPNVENAALGAGVVLIGSGLLRIGAQAVLKDDGTSEWRARLTDAGLMGYIGSGYSNAETVKRANAPNMRPFGYVDGRMVRKGVMRQVPPPSPREMVETGPQLPVPNQGGVVASWVTPAEGFAGFGGGGFLANQTSASFQQ